jgi:hypothetical protein
VQLLGDDREVTQVAKLHNVSALEQTRCQHPHRERPPQPLTFGGLIVTASWARPQVGSKLPTGGQFPYDPRSSRSRASACVAAKSTALDDPNMTEQRDEQRRGFHCVVCLGQYGFRPISTFTFAENAPILDVGRARAHGIARGSWRCRANRFRSRRRRPARGS